MAAEPVHHLLQLQEDALTAVWSFVDLDDAFAASLASSKLNAARADAPLCTRICSTLRSPSLRQWADALGCPSPYPHWVELHGLVAAVQYNGRVGLARKPPDESGRMPVEVDGGLGECKAGLRHAVVVLIRPANTRPLTELGYDLVLAVHLLPSRPSVHRSDLGGTGGSGSEFGRRMRQVSLPRAHSCFLREAVH